MKKNKKEEFLLKSDFLNWKIRVQMSSVYSDEDWKRSYDYWKHSENLLLNPTTEFQRIDIITSLNRAITHRLKRLNELYSFKKIPLKEKPSKLLEQLEYFGLIRPIMLEQLISVRNAVEHDHISPPENDKCNEYLEFVWYFLRSTDRLVRQVTESLIFYNPDENDPFYSIEVRTGSKYNWQLGIGGWLRFIKAYSSNDDNNFIVILNKKKIYKEWLKQLGEYYSKIFANSSGRNPNDFYFQGNISGPGNLMKELIEIYFSAI